LIARRSGTDETEWVRRLQLVEFLEARSPELSRGERKRAALAAALIANPACLILDEPFESVAPKDKDLLTQCLKTVVGQGQGVLITGHDTGAILEAATHVTWCVAGTTHDLGSVTEALDTPQFVREYLGPGFSAS
jgi:ABC-type Mn2+/Zn2+ transport system ATPase subunit